MNESEKRDFINMMLQLVKEENERLVAEGYNADAKVSDLIEKRDSSENAEILQQQAAVAAKEATDVSNLKLNEAYKSASNLADAISGILGKEDALVKKMRKFRK